MYLNDRDWFTLCAQVDALTAKTLAQEDHFHALLDLIQAKAPINPTTLACYEKKVDRSRHEHRSREHAGQIPCTDPDCAPGCSLRKHVASEFHSLMERVVRDRNRCY